MTKCNYYSLVNDEYWKGIYLRCICPYHILVNLTGTRHPMHASSSYGIKAGRNFPVERRSVCMARQSRGLPEFYLILTCLRWVPASLESSYSTSSYLAPETWRKSAGKIR